MRSIIVFSSLSDAKVSPIYIGKSNNSVSVIASARPRFTLPADYGDVGDRAESSSVHPWMYFGRWVCGVVQLTWWTVRFVERQSYLHTTAHTVLNMCYHNGDHRTSSLLEQRARLHHQINHSLPRRSSWIYCCAIARPEMYYVVFCSGTAKVQNVVFISETSYPEHRPQLIGQCACHRGTSEI